jgi:hypothetical protein
MINLPIGAGLKARIRITIDPVNSVCRLAFSTRSALLRMSIARGGKRRSRQAMSENYARQIRFSTRRYVIYDISSRVATIAQAYIIQGA